jgi:hypothetical protein
LFALLATRFEPMWLWVGCATLAGLGLLGLLVLLRLDARAEPGPHELVAVRSAGGEAAAYLASYLLPFVTVSVPGWRDVLAYAGFLLVAAAVYVRTPVIQVNPLLYVLGYQVWSIRDTGGLESYLVSRRRVSAGDKILATRFGPDVLIRRRS